MSKITMVRDMRCAITVLSLFIDMQFKDAFWSRLLLQNWFSLTSAFALKLHYLSLHAISNTT